MLRLPSATSESIDSIARDLKIKDILSTKVGLLSGGQRRLVSVAMALIGDSSLIILDEPAASLDQESSAYVWEAIKRIKGTRTFLVTTQSIEETNLLADRVAILNEGSFLRVCTPLELKREFALDLRISILIRPGSSESSKYRVLKLMNEHVPDAQRVDTIGPCRLSFSVSSAHKKGILTFISGKSRST